MIKKFIRITLGILLIFTVFPPITMNVMNIFVLVLPAVGVVLIMLPVILRVLKAISGRHYKKFIIAGVAVLAAAAVFYAVEFCFIFSASFPQSAPGNPVVIVLGAKAEGDTPSPILRGRINAAAAYLKAHPDAVCIASGGQGGDEKSSEALCIRDVLVDNFGIATGRIYMDEASTDTSQNMDNSLKIIRDNGLNDNVLIATDGFHMFRAKLLASRRGLKPYALPAKTNRNLVVELYVRELIGLPKSVLLNR